MRSLRNVPGGTFSSQSTIARTCSFGLMLRATRARTVAFALPTSDARIAWDSWFRFVNRSPSTRVKRPIQRGRASSATRCDPTFPPAPRITTCLPAFLDRRRRGVERRLGFMLKLFGGPRIAGVQISALDLAQGAGCVVGPAGEFFGLVMPGVAMRASHRRLARL